MKTRVTFRTIVPAFLAMATVSAAFADEGHGAASTAASGGVDVLPAILWSLAGVAIFAVVMGVLYLFKRQVGGFPENPEWVAPISIMRSRDLPSEDDAHGHGDSHGHDAHAPAH
jgi:hypothetical protein